MTAIDRIEIQTIRLRLKEPFRISSGVTDERRILLVKLDGGGERGYGECVAGETPHYSYETVDLVGPVLERHLVPVMLEESFESARSVGPALDRAAKGYPMAKAALEMAAWDLEAKLRDVPLFRLLGGVRGEVPAGVSIGIQETVEHLLDRIGAFVEQGYRRIKIKVKPGWDVDVVRRVRERFPAVPLTVDANAAYTMDDIDRLTELDGFGLAMIEQPFAAEDLVALAELQARLSTPVCLDESVTSPEACRAALRLGSGRIVNIKPGRVGGHAASLRIHDACEEAAVPVWCGGMLESGIGRAHNVALATLPNFSLPGDTSASSRYWVRDVIRPAFELRPNGTLSVPDGAGIGVEVDEAFLTEIETDRRVFDAA